MRMSDWSSDVCSSDLDIGHRLDREAAVVGGPGRNLFRREEREHIDVVAERKPVASVDRLDTRNGRLNNVLVKVPNAIEDQLINRRSHVEHGRGVGAVARAPAAYAPFRQDEYVTPRKTDVEGESVEERKGTVGGPIIK